jgi:hypothetical protein
MNNENARILEDTVLYFIVLCRNSSINAEEYHEGSDWKLGCDLKQETQNKKPIVH